MDLRHVTQSRTADRSCGPLPATGSRLLERLIAGLGLMLLSPLLIAIGVVIKGSSRGPAFFRQVRVGAGQRPFVMWKFRTMRGGNLAAHEEHVKSLMNTDAEFGKADERLPVTVPGRILRVTFLDELPQLINVVRGEMSLVGPRPLHPYEVAELEPWQQERHRVAPGMTGLWQVSGKNELSFEEMLRLDIDYVRTRSLGLDSRILLRTVPMLWGGLLASFSGRRAEPSAVSSGSPQGVSTGE